MVSLTLHDVLLTLRVDLASSLCSPYVRLLQSGIEISRQAAVPMCMKAVQPASAVDNSHEAAANVHACAAVPPHDTAHLCALGEAAAASHNHAQTNRNNGETCSETAVGTTLASVGLAQDDVTVRTYGVTQLPLDLSRSTSHTCASIPHHLIPPHTGAPRGPLFLRRL